MIPRRKRRPLIPLCALAVLLGLAALTAGRAQNRSSAAGARPNILFLLTDDQDLLLDSLAYMPNVRSLIAEQGITFSNDFVPLSLCCPSRSSILTGQYAHNHRVYTNAAPDGGFKIFFENGLEDRTIGTALHAAGYRTGLLGKYLNAYPAGTETTHVPPGWDEWDVPVGGAAYNEFNYTLNQNGTLIRHGHTPADYLTDVMAARAVQFIRAAAADKVPFFLYLGTYAPHKPFTPAPRHAQLFPGVQAPRTPSFNEANVRDKPDAGRKLPLLGPADIALLDTQYRLRLQSLQAVDEMVAALISTLRDSGQLDNTYIFFTSDNGYHLGQHRRKAGKYTPYEEDVRVPLLVRGPGVPAGRTVDAFTENVDFAPTFAALGGATLRGRGDGRSLVPLLSGNPPPASWRRAVLLEQFAFHETPEGTGGVLEPSETTEAAGVQEYPTHLGLRTPAYKYVEYSTEEREYYDLVNDPHELQNLASQMSTKFLNRLSGIVHALSTCTGETCRRLEAQPVPPPH
jgi:N-acetylglucosamine-6-sulfatase